MMETPPPIGSRVRITNRVPNKSWWGAIVEIIEECEPYLSTGKKWPCYGRLISQHPEADRSLKPGQRTNLELWYIEPLEATPEEIESAIAGVEAILADEF